MLLHCYWVGSKLSVQGHCVLQSSTQFFDISASHTTIHSNAVLVGVTVAIANIVIAVAAVIVVIPTVMACQLQSTRYPPQSSLHHLHY